MRLSVNWMEKYGNCPYFVLEASKDLIPQLKSCEMSFHNGMWVHVAPNGFVRYFAHSGSDRNEGGYGGAAFTFLHNGQEKTLYGPWSSRAGCVNQLGYDVVDITLRDPRGGSYAACITKALLMQLLDEQQPDFYVVEDVTGEPVCYPSMHYDRIMKPNFQEIDRNHEFRTIWRPENA